MEESLNHWHEVDFDYVNEMKKLGKDRLVVSAVIVWEDKVLLVRRSQDDTYPGLWEFPGGGVDDDEKVVDALKREVFEETNIELTELPRGEIFTHPTRTALRIVVRYDIDFEPNIVLSHEHDAFIFADIETIAGQNLQNQEIYTSLREENIIAAQLVLNKNQNLT